MASDRGHNWSVRRVGTVVAMGAALLVLAGCGPIVVDATTFQATSSATVQVVPTKLEVNGQQAPGIDIQFRWCKAVHFKNVPSDFGFPADWNLVPKVAISDKDSHEVFSLRSSPIPTTIDGWSESLDPNSASGGLDHVYVPTEGLNGPLTISAGCTSSVYGPSQAGQPTVAWTFTACHTAADLSCPLGTEGTFSFGRF